MSQYCRRRLVLAALALALGPAMAAAQALDRPYGLSFGPVAIGGELSAVFGPADDDAFFNYTDYEHNALRMARVRLTGDWRIRTGLSLVGEIRTENASDVDLAGLYLRWMPWAARGLTIQAGRVPPVIGAYPRRAYGRDALMPGTPLAYQYLTSLRPDALPVTTDDLLRMRARGWRPAFPLGSATVATGIPIVSASRWDTGVEAHWDAGAWEVAGAITRGAPAVPVVQETNGGRQYSARAAAHLPSGLSLGIWAARGQWIERDVLTLVPGDLRDRSAQRLVGGDLEFGRGRWLVRAEALRSVFELPLVGAPAGPARLGAWSAFTEVRYRVHPRWQIAARGDTLQFSDIEGASGVTMPWDLPVGRAEAVIGVRATRHIELRAGWQQNWRTRPGPTRTARTGFPVAQMLYWF